MVPGFRFRGARPLRHFGGLFAAALVASALALAGSAPAKAALALDFTGGTIDSYGTPGFTITGGWTFNVVGSPVLLTDLGFWDEGADGISQDHAVALWTSGGALLSSTTVTNLSTPVSSITTGGRWLFTSVTPIVLAPGSYVIGAQYEDSVNGFDTVRFGATATTTPGVVFTGAATSSSAVAGSGIVLPGTPVPGLNDGIFGPNLIVSAVTIVPEANTGSLMLLSGSLAAGSILIARRRRRQIQVA